MTNKQVYLYLKVVANVYHHYLGIILSLESVSYKLKASFGLGELTLHILLDTK